METGKQWAKLGCAAGDELNGASIAAHSEHFSGTSCVPGSWLAAGAGPDLTSGVLRACG